MKKLMPVGQIAKRLGVSDTLLYQEIEKGVLPHFLIGGRILLDPDEIMRVARRKADEWRAFVKARRRAIFWTLGLRG